MPTLEDEVGMLMSDSATRIRGGDYAPDQTAVIRDFAKRRGLEFVECVTRLREPFEERVRQLRVEHDAMHALAGEAHGLLPCKASATVALAGERVAEIARRHHLPTARCEELIGELGSALTDAIRRVANGDPAARTELADRLVVWLRPLLSEILSDDVRQRIGTTGNEVSHWYIPKNRPPVSRPPPIGSSPARASSRSRSGSAKAATRASGKERTWFSAGRSRSSLRSRRIRHWREGDLPASSGIGYYVCPTEEAVLADLTDDTRRAILSAATLLTGHTRRRFQAEMAHQYCRGSARLAETTFGWGRDAVETGLNELRFGIRCVEDFESRGRPTTRTSTRRWRSTSAGGSIRTPRPTPSSRPPSPSPASPPGPSARRCGPSRSCTGWYPPARPSAISSTASGTSCGGCRRPGRKKADRHGFGGGAIRRR